MISDAATPQGLSPSGSAVVERRGVLYSAACWTPDVLALLGDSLADTGHRALSSLPEARLLEAWGATVEELRDPNSIARRILDPSLEKLCGLSPEGLIAGLDAVLGGVRRSAAERIFGAARSAATPAPVLVVLASNLPGLAVQPLLPLLALRRPTILKSPSSEPLFAPAFVNALVRQEPALGNALAALTWPGGDTTLETPLLSRVGRVIAYGESETLRDLERRAAGKILAHGPKSSLAVVADDALDAATISGLARDIALFDQRGCLSIHAVFTDADVRPVAEALAAALAVEARRLPPGPIDPVVVAAVQQVRLEAEMRGLPAPQMPIQHGTVVVEPEPRFRPSPGLRTVRIHPISDLSRLPALLEPWEGSLQGAALAGAAAWSLTSELERLGVSRCASPGELQSPDATWHDGGFDPLEALRED